jgi:hypothetical protein
MDYGNQLAPPQPAMTPEDWIAQDKLMPGALYGYSSFQKICNTTSKKQAPQ